MPWRIMLVEVWLSCMGTELLLEENRVRLLKTIVGGHPRDLRSRVVHLILRRMGCRLVAIPGIRMCVHLMPDQDIYVKYGFLRTTTE